MINKLTKSPIEKIVQDIKEKGELVVLLKFGSHMYGTETPESDTDYKGIYIPKMEDVILGNVPKSSINISTGDVNGKNGSKDIDVEFFTLKGFMQLVKEGQVCALDMLFVNGRHLLESSPVWDTIIENREKLLHKKTTAFIGYCRKQASKYGIKGGRLAEVKELKAWFESKIFEDPSWQEDRLSSIKLFLESEFLKDKKHINIIEGVKPQRNIGGGGVKNPMANIYLEILGKKVGFTDKVSTAITMCNNLIDRYGDRAKLAEENKGVDWKALHHATRCCYEACELLQIGHITLPFPDAILEDLMNIKLGKVEYKVVAESLEKAMIFLEKCKEESDLPDEPDTHWINRFIIKIYLDKREEKEYV